MGKMSEGNTKPPNTACTRPPIRREFQSYFRVVIILRGARVMCRSRTAADGLAPARLRFAAASPLANRRMNPLRLRLTSLPTVGD
jgi:hypothetical protein